MNTSICSSVKGGRKNYRRNATHAFPLATTLVLQCGAGPALANAYAPVAPVSPFIDSHPKLMHENGALLNHNFANTLITPTHLPIMTPHVTLPTGASLLNQGMVLNLSSSVANITLGALLFPKGGTVTINVGGTTQTFKAGDVVTAGEYLAIKEILKSGNQTIDLNQQGTADGGSFTLNSVASSKLTELVIPASVTAYDYFSSNKTISVTGDILNYGSIYGISSSPSVKSGVIAAADIVDEAGGVISTQLAGTALQSNHSLQSSVNLTLDVSDNLTNYGTISSSGGLNLVAAGGSINNLAASSSSTPAIRAQDTINISAGSGNLTNNGQILSNSGNINIATPAVGTNLDINSSNGTLQALNGNINIRNVDYAGNANVNLQGGNYLSQNLNLFSGNGAITTDVGEITGTVNTVGYSAHEFADTGNLVLGNNTLKGDPTFVNTGGNITIDGGVVATEAITILASGNIIGTGDAYISTAHETGQSATAAAGDITLVAGATVTTSGATTSTLPGAPIGTGNTATVSFASGGGGSINFSKSTHAGTTIAASSNLEGNGNQQANGGNVTLVAYGTNATNGQILFPTTQASITTTSTYGTSGNVTILAGQVGSSTKPAISVAGISTGANSLLGTANGSILIESAQASSTSTATYNSSGALTSGSITPSTTLGSGSIALNGVISAGSSAVNASTVTIETSGTGAISEAGKGTTISAPDIILQNQTAGLGKSSTSAFSTETGNLTVNSQGNVFLNNIGSTTLNAATYGNSTMKSATFSLLTTSNGGGGGAIGINGDITPTTASGGTSTIILQSSELPGTGAGIYDSSKSTLFATSVILSDGPKGMGVGGIGTAGRPILTESTNPDVPLNLTVNGSGNAYMQNTGSVSLANSTAGNNSVFSLATAPDSTLGNGQIIVAGTVKSASGSIGTLSLTSSESGGSGGIIQSKGGLTAAEVLLADNEYVAGKSSGLGTGDGNLGTSTKPILITAGEIGASSGIGNTAGNVSITDSAKGGIVLVANSKNTDDSAFNSFNLSTASGIFVSSELETTSTTSGAISLKAAGSGYLIVNNDLIASGTNGTINLTASGTGAISGRGSAGLLETDISGSGGSSGTVSLTSGSGGIAGMDINTSNLTLSSVGNASVTNEATSGQNLTVQSAAAKGSLGITTGAGLTILGPLTTPAAISLTAGISANGSIDINNNIGGSGTKSVSIIDASTGNIITNINGKITPTISAQTTVNLNAANGSIAGANGAQMLVSAPILTANNVSGTAGTNAINLESVYKKTVTLTNSASDGDFTLNAANSLLLTNLLSVNGSLDVVAAGPSLATAQNSIIGIGSSKTDAAAGSQIILENSNVKTGTINIGAGSNISAYVTSGTDVINVSIGAPPATPPSSAGTIPTGVVFSPAAGSTGPYFFPTQGITVTNPANVQMTSVGGGQIVFTIPTGVKATAITVEGGAGSTPTTFYADPPNGASAPQAVNAPALSSQTVNTAGMITASASNSANSSLPANISSSPLLSASAANQSSLQSPTNTSIAGQTPLIGAVQSSNLGLLQASMSSGTNAANAQSPGEPQWISETEVEKGMVPATIISDQNLGVTQAVSSILELKEENNIATNDATPAIKLAKGQAANESAKTISFNRGAVLFAPTTETEVKTPYGTISIAAHALVFAVCLQNGVAVYNLDDRHANSVSINASGAKQTLSPGQMAALTSSRIKSFDMLNPCQMTLYRNLNQQALAAGGNLFVGEFFAPSLVGHVMPLKALMLSNEPAAKKVTNSLCKTMAILMQLNGNNDYTQVLSAPLAAMLPR